MAVFGVGIYLLCIVWFVTLMLCWVSVRTGHYAGKAAVAVSAALTVVFVVLPKGDVHYTHGANFYDKVFVLRYSTLAILLLGIVVGSVFCFVHACLAPVETKKLGRFGTVN